MLKPNNQPSVFLYYLLIFRKQILMHVPHKMCAVLFYDYRHVQLSNETMCMCCLSLGYCFNISFLYLFFTPHTLFHTETGVDTIFFLNLSCRMRAFTSPFSIFFF